MTHQSSGGCTEAFFGGLARPIAVRKQSDSRGTLTPFAFEELPFQPCRCFVVRGSAAGTIRGGHAHQKTTQLLMCLHGRIEVRMRCADEEVYIVLAPDSHGLLIRPSVWAEQRYVVADSVLLVFADERYDPDSYVRSSAGDSGLQV